MSKTYKAMVVVATREGGHGGWYQSGKFWGAGQHEDVELTQEEVQGLARRPGIVVFINGRPVKPTEQSGPPKQAEQVTDDEAQVLAEYRAQRARDAKRLEAAQAETAKLEFTGEKRKEAMARAFEQAPGPSQMGAADAPLQDADILHGKPPDVGVTAPVPTKPIEQLRTEVATQPKGGGKNK